MRASDHPWDSHLVDVNEAGRIRAFHSPGHHPPNPKNTANAALFACSRRILDQIPARGASDFSNDIFPLVLGNGKTLQAYRLPEHEFVKYMGTPDRLAFVRAYDRWKRAVRRATASRPRPPARVVFLD